MLFKSPFAPCAITAILKNHALVPLLLSPTTKSASPVPLLDRIDIHIEVPRVELISPNSDKHTIAQCDLEASPRQIISFLKPRAVSLAPHVHLAIINPAMLRADMHQVFAEDKDGSYLVFITGPSHTADIELAVTLGVHGPKNLYLWMTRLATPEITTTT